MYIKDLLKSIKDLFQSSDNSNKQFELNCEKTDSQDNSIHNTITDSNIIGNVFNGVINKYDSPKKNTKRKPKSFFSDPKIILTVIMVILILYGKYLLPYISIIKTLLAFAIVIFFIYNIYMVRRTHTRALIKFFIASSVFAILQLYLLLFKFDILSSFTLKDISLNVLIQIFFLISLAFSHIYFYVDCVLYKSNKISQVKLAKSNLIKAFFPVLTYYGITLLSNIG